MADEMNAQAPLQVDEDTRMMSVVALQGTVTFNVRLPRYSSLQVDSAAIARDARESLNHTACSNKATRDLIGLGAKYVYLYYGNDGKLITRVVIDRYRCLRAPLYGWASRAATRSSTRHGAILCGQ